MTTTVTKRVASGLASATVTKRVGAGASGGAKRRVNLGSHHSSYDCWARTWGGAWANTWHNFLSASELSGNITQRVSETTPLTESVLRYGHLLRENGTDAVLREDGSFLLLEGKATVPVT